VKDRETNTKNTRQKGGSLRRARTEMGQSARNIVGTREKRREEMGRGSKGMRRDEEGEKANWGVLLGSCRGAAKKHQMVATNKKYI
jgi:hypothetical protein